MFEELVLVDRSSRLFTMRLRMNRLMPILIGISIISLSISFFLLHRLIAEALFHGYSGQDSMERLEHQLLAERAKQVAAAHRTARILQPDVVKNKTYIPVFVVEEHFEVLKHWFDAVKVGVIPKTGNTLLHIDGHSDGAVPHDLSVVPQFRPPRNHSEVVSMMQSNDVFIVAAALAGLIKRYIWVWPAWDYKDHEKEAGHEAYDVQVGWRTFYPSKGDPVQRLCACSRQRPKAGDVSGKQAEWECWDHEPENHEPQEGPVISSMSCTMELKGSVEIVSEVKAVELLEAGGWITEEDHLLLDIDEDYYGCESSVMPLYNAGLPQTTIDAVSDLISKLLCVTTAEQEQLADLFFHTMIQTVLKFKKSLCQPHRIRRDCITTSALDRILIQKIPDFINSLLVGKFKGILCDKDEKTSGILLQVTLRLLENLNATQLKALDYVGICLMTAPTNYFFEANKSPHVCHGPNTPNQTEVTFHVPVDVQNEERTDLLKNMLSLLPKEPNAITVCRSVRDGYTPWKFFRQIENGIFSTLQEVFTRVSKENSYHFDENLLGGSSGWPDRHKFTSPG